MAPLHLATCTSTVMLLSSLFEDGRHYIASIGGTKGGSITPIPSSISCNQLQFHIIINSQLVEQYLRGVTRTVSQSIEFVKEEVSLQLQGSISADWKLESHKDSKNPEQESLLEERVVYCV